MTKMICVDENYSTTRLVTREQPIIKNKPEDQFESVLFLPEIKKVISIAIKLAVHGGG